MASTKRMTTADGQVFYKIRVHISRDRPTLSMRWYAPVGWSQKSIDRELAKVAADFERRCKEGEVLSRNEAKEKEQQEAQAAAAIQTVKQFCEKVFLPSKELSCTKNTMASFRGSLNNHIYPRIGAMPLPDVSSADLNSLLLDFRASGQSHGSCVKIYTVLGLIFKMAYMQDLIPRNPMDKTERPKPRTDEIKSGDPESFTVDEIKYIFQCLEKEPLQWQAFIRLMADTGIRRGEACGLTWKHIDTKRNQITICQTLNYTKADGVFISTTKNGKQRTIDVDPSVIQLLKRLKASQEKARAGKKIVSLAPVYHSSNVPPDDYVFLQEDGITPIFPQSPEHYMRKFSERYGVNHLHPHKLRHSFASIAITSGADVASISEILGHSDTAVTLRVYAHADDESRKRASDIFRDALKEKQA